MSSSYGEGAELRVFLEEALGVPHGARRFSVTFEDGQPVRVTVEFLPVETWPAIPDEEKAT